MPSDRTRLAPVDGLRGLAAMMVVIGHIHLAAGSPSLGVLSNVLVHLNTGVDLFFVLSGFCLFYPLTKPGSAFQARGFFRRRARRIIPPYYVAIGAVLLLPPIIGAVARRLGLFVFAAAGTSWQQLWTHLLFVHTLFPSTFFGIDGPFWTLGVEMQFYLAFPIAVWLVRRYHWGGIACIALTTILYQLGVSKVVHTAQAATYLTGGNATVDVKALFFLGRWLEFGLGMAIAMLVRQRRIAGIRPPVELLAVLGCCGLWIAANAFAAGAPDRWLLPVTNPLLGVTFALLLLLGCTPGTYTGYLLSRRAPVWIGTISYSLYLIHLPMLLALGPVIMIHGFGNPGTVIVLSLVGLPIVLACAALFFYFFERPFLNPGRRETQPAGFVPVQPGMPSAEPVRVVPS